MPTKLALPRIDFVDKQADGAITTICRSPEKVFLSSVKNRLPEGFINPPRLFSSSPQGENVERLEPSPTTQKVADNGAVHIERCAAAAKTLKLCRTAKRLS